MIDTTGHVTGVVFGAALDDPETGFVLTVDQMLGRRPGRARPHGRRLDGALRGVTLRGPA